MNLLARLVAGFVFSLIFAMAAIVGLLLSPIALYGWIRRAMRNTHTHRYERS